jgi:ribonuclease VapC
VTPVVVDTSALVAVILGQPDAARYLDAMVRGAGDLQVSAANLVEAAIVVQARQGSEAATDLQSLISQLPIVIQDLDHGQAQIAINAWRRFGKGRHPAGLNLGDCFAYALAQSMGGRLLFKGADFAQTDIASALP